MCIRDRLTNDASQSRTYVNGAIKSTGASGVLEYSATPLYIGAQPDSGNGAWYEGLIDDLRIYDFVLSESQITEIITNGDLNLTDLPIPSLIAGKFGDSLVLPESGYAKADSDQVSLLNELTLSMWAKIHNDNAGVLARNGQFSLQYETDNTVRASVYTGGAWHITRSRSILGEWAHHAMTYDLSLIHI